MSTHVCMCACVGMGVCMFVCSTRKHVCVGIHMCV